MIYMYSKSVFKWKPKYFSLLPTSHLSVKISPFFLIILIFWWMKKKKLKACQGSVFYPPWKIMTAQVTGQTIPRGYLVVLTTTIYPGIYTGGGLLSQGHFQLMLMWLEQHTVNAMDDKHGNGMLCFVVVLSSVASEFRIYIYPYSLGLLQWYCDKEMIIIMLVK